jgi:hypothetical protein
MPLDPALAGALRPFARRAVFVAFVENVAAAAIASALALEIAMLLGVRSLLLTAVIIALSAAGSAAFAVRQRPAALALARRIDARARLNDLIITSVSCAGDGWPALVRRAGIRALQGESPRLLFPLEAPRRWRRWLGAVAAAQLIAVPLAFRAPASRASATSVPSLALPAANGPAAAAAAPQDHKSQPAAAEAPRAESALPSGSVDAARQAREVSQNGVAKSAPADSGSRLKIASTNAEAEIAAGRVPLARRAIVEKYFAAIQNQKERHR